MKNIVLVSIGCILCLSTIETKPSHEESAFIIGCRSLTTRPGLMRPSEDTEARHHIIPIHVLRRFFEVAWQMVQDSPSGSQSAGLANFLYRYVSEIFDSYYTLASSTAPDGSLANRRSLISYGIRTQLDEGGSFHRLTQVLHTMFVWMPGNIFYGPSLYRRSDDPRGEFEANAIHIVGDKHFRRLQALHKSMLNFITDRERTRSIPTMNSIFRRLEQIHRMEPFAYNPFQWIQDGDLYRIRLPEDGHDDDHSDRDSDSDSNIESDSDNYSDSDSYEEVFRGRDISRDKYVPGPYLIPAPIEQQEPYCFVSWLDQVYRPIWQANNSKPQTCGRDICD